MLEPTRRTPRARAPKRAPRGVLRLRGGRLPVLRHGDHGDVVEERQEDHVPRTKADDPSTRGFPPPPPAGTGANHRVEWRKVRRKGKRWEDPPRNLPSGQPKRGGHLVSRKLGGLNQEPHKISPVWMTWRCREVRKQSHGARLVHIVCSRYPRSPCRQGTRGRGYSQRHRPKYSNRARSGWWQPGDRRRT